MGGGEGFLLEAVDGLFVLDFLDDIGQCLAGGYKLEGGLVSEVLEVLAGFPADVDGLDVGCGEGVGGHSPFGLDAWLEVAKVAEADALSFEQEFTEAADGEGEQADDVALLIDASVVGDVLCKGVDVNGLFGLCHAVSLGLGDVLLLGAGLGAHDCDTVVNHNSNV